MERLKLTFMDRADAGRQLAKVLAALELDHPLIYALPNTTEDKIYWLGLGEGCAQLPVSHRHAANFGCPRNETRDRK